jgi:hypothetical protein
LQGIVPIAPSKPASNNEIWMEIHPVVRDLSSVDIFAIVMRANFQLKPNLVGVMPLGQHPRLGDSHSSWNGVCAVLAISKR